MIWGYIHTALVDTEAEADEFLEGLPKWGCEVITNNKNNSPWASYSINMKK